MALSCKGENILKKRGIGYSCTFYGIGYGNGFPDISRASAEITCDGKFIIYAAVADVGQGSRNVMLQIASETLETDINNISIIDNNTKDLMDSGTTAATRQTYNTGNAVFDACRKLKEGMSALSDQNDNLAEIYELMIKHDTKTKTDGYFKAKTTMLDTNTGQGEPYWPYSFGVQKAVVEVDDETGKVDVVDLTACHDVGKAINPEMVEAQVQGGCAMGLGFGLMEETIIKDGFIENKNFSDYIIPTSLDIPDIKTIIVEDEEITGPYGAKGVGEPALLPAAPAIINAIYDAVGIRISSLPASEEKIIEALKEKRRNTKCPI